MKEEERGKETLGAKTTHTHTHTHTPTTTLPHHDGGLLCPHSLLSFPPFSPSYSFLYLHPHPLSPFVFTFFSFSFLFFFLPFFITCVSTPPPLPPRFQSPSSQHNTTRKKYTTHTSNTGKPSHSSSPPQLPSTPNYLLLYVFSQNPLPPVTSRLAFFIGSLPPSPNPAPPPVLSIEQKVTDHVKESTDACGGIFFYQHVRPSARCQMPDATTFLSPPPPPNHPISLLPSSWDEAYPV